MRKTYFRPSSGYYGLLRDKEFIAKVDTVLHQHSGTGVKHMEIKFGLHSKHADHIDRWVNFAIASKTKEFVIDLSGRAKSSFFTELARRKQIVREEPYNLPSQLFSPNNGSYLRRLELRTVSLQLPSDFKGFLNLKSLALVDKTIVPEGPFRFTYLRNLRLELILCSYENRKTDVLDYAYLLKIAPFMETLELPMWMNCQHRPYSKEDGELRVGLPQQHNHLKSVRISGFFGHKGQVELPLHILRRSIALEKMEITPKLEISNYLAGHDCLYEDLHYVDGHRVATEFKFAKQTIAMLLMW
ncbi:hypothetical protein C2845_PM07G21510 [Panicum miliaceum]|uniref:At1g61320/AtMIF1 LRR domain-containing protein n=1 Tax=Panicum miliaceum TaxID=4540 RepID=A0A3L6SPY0_PANMI|nr:hypothetical protein C2845_PM07G21510 [Panicum miliaceum]